MGGDDKLRIYFVGPNALNAVLMVKVTVVESQILYCGNARVPYALPKLATVSFTLATSPQIE